MSKESLKSRQYLPDTAALTSGVALEQGSGLLDRIEDRVIVPNDLPVLTSKLVLEHWW